MIVAGVMSGTSADGINVALVRVTASARPRPGRPPSDFLATPSFPIPKQFASAVLAAMNSTKASVADLARLNFLLAELYAEAVLATQRRFHLKAELVGCHGQTLYHQGEAARVSRTQARGHLANWRRRGGGRTRRRAGGF